MIKAHCQSEAQRALAIIQHYGFNGQCFDGRPHPSMEFYLVNGRAPQGSMRGGGLHGLQPCQPRGSIPGWALEGGRGHDFDQEQHEARQALSYILRYQFRSICFVGRPGPSLTYFKA